VSAQRVLRIAGALPDAVVALGCLVVWIAPHAIGVHWVKQVVVAMLVEFLAVHSGAFFSGVLEHSSGGWRRMVVPYLLLASLYVLFAGAFALAFGTWWPLQAMVVLIGMKFWTLILDRDTSSREAARQQGIWVASCAAYLIGAFLTAVLPVPEFGIDAAARAAADLPGTGAWVEQPQRVVAFAMAYFALLAWMKLTHDPMAPTTGQGARSS